MEKTYWYAVMQGNYDDDWGYGSYNLAEAEKMVESFQNQGYTDAYIAVIDEGNDPICVEEIR
ncbi:MAG: hypothetical protein J6J18_06620 [Oscillospiraceae bacterium]|nr:hypothetical protein [Oscillospiraceae bacterium]